MTAPLSAAESFLALLDDLAGTKPNGATAAVLLQHAGTHIRDLLDQVHAMEREADEDAELDAVLERVRENVREHVAANLAKPDLSHLPPKAADGEPVCDATSPPDHEGMWWTCSARIGHPERWHAWHAADGSPVAAFQPSAMWPVADRELDLPRWAIGFTFSAGEKRMLGVRACGATEGRWTCNAAPGHAPLDHVSFGAWESRMPGAVLARWASADSGTRPEDSENVISRFRTAQDVRRSEVLGPPAPVCTACRTQNGPVIDGLCADCAIDAADETRFRLAAADGGDPA